MIGFLFFFFFNDTATTEIYTLSLHDALPISGQDLRRIGLAAAFELLDLLGTAPFRWHWGFPDPHHPNWRAIGFELQFILLAIRACRDTGDAGNLPLREISQLLACSSRQFDKRRRQAVDFRSVLGSQQHPVDSQFV